MKNNYPEKESLIIEYDSLGKLKEIQYKRYVNIIELNCKENNIFSYIISDEEFYKILQTIIKKFNDYPSKE